MAAMFIQNQPSCKDNPQVKQTMEDVVEEMIDGIFCHYEPPDPTRIEGTVHKKRRGILRTPKVFRRKNKKSTASKSVRWSDTHEEEEEEEQKQQIASQKKFPIEIHCNVSRTCTDVGIEAGCLSPNSDAYIYEEETGFTKKREHEDDIRQQYSESDATEDEDDDRAPPPPPPPKSKLNLKSSSTKGKSALKSSSSSPTSSSSKSKSKKQRGVVFDEDGNPMSKRGKTRLPPSAPHPSTKEKYMPELTGVGINLKDDEEHLAELARSSREGPPSKLYHRPRQVYDYEDVDDFNNSILEDSKRDKLLERELKRKGYEKSSGGLRRRSGSFEDDSETNTSTFSNTSSLFQRLWRRNPKSSSKEKKVAGDPGRSVSPARFRQQEQDPVDMVRSPGRVSSFLRAMSPRSKSFTDEADWDESVPIVRGDVKKKSSGESRSRPLTREAEPAMRRARSRSADSKGGRSQSPSLSRTRSRSLDDENRMRSTHRTSQQEGIQSYYHPAHPLNRSQLDESMERQSLITAHRQGFDRASTATTAYSDAIERQSYITAHRQTHEGPPASAMVRPISYSQQRDDQMERQSYITAHRQVFDPPPARETPPYQPQYQQQYRPPSQPVAVQGRVSAPAAYQYPLIQAPMPTQGRSASPAPRGRSASPAPRGRSPSPSRAHAMMRQRSQSPGKARASSPYRRRSFDPQYSYAHVQPVQQHFQGGWAYDPPTQQQMMMQRSMVPYQQPYPQQYYIPASGLPHMRPPGKSSPRRPQALPPGPRPQAVATVGPQQQAGYGNQRVIGQPPQVHGAGEQAMRLIPNVLPKSRSSASTSTKSLADEISNPDPNRVDYRTYDPLSIHDPRNSREQYYSMADPASTNGQQWNPVETRGYSVVGPQWGTEEKGTCGGIPGQENLSVTETLTTEEIESKTETKQTQGEGSIEDKEATDVELTWEERTRQAWERIRSGLVVFGEPKETECASLSPCGDASRMKLQEEPVILPEHQSDQPVSANQQFPVYPGRSTEPVILPVNRSLLHPQQQMQPQLYMLPQCGDGREVLQQPSYPPGILKHPSYDRRVTFGEPTEQIYNDFDDEIRSYDSRMMPRRRRVFRGRKLIKSLFGKKNNKAGGGDLNLNTKSTESSSVVSGSVSQEWDGTSASGGGSYYYAPQIEGSVQDPREPGAGDFAVQRQYNPSCPVGIYNQQ